MFYLDTTNSYEKKGDTSHQPSASVEAANFIPKQPPKKCETSKEYTKAYLKLFYFRVIDRGENTVFTTFYKTH